MINTPPLSRVRTVTLLIASTVLLSGASVFIAPSAHAAAAPGAAVAQTGPAAPAARQAPGLMTGSGWEQISTISSDSDVFGVASDFGTASTFVATGKDEIAVIDDHTNDVVDSIHTSTRVEVLAADPAAGRVFGIDKGNTTVLAIDTAIRQVVHQSVLPARPTAITVDSSRGRVFVSLANKTLAMIDAATGESQRIIQVPTGIDEVTVDAVTGTVFAAGLMKVIAITPDDGSTRTVLSGPVVSGLTADAGTVYVAAADRHGVIAIDAATGTERSTVPTGPLPLRAAVDPVAHVLFVTDDQADTTTIIDTTTNTVTATVKVGNRPWWVGVDPGTHTAYVSSWGENTVTVIGPTIAPHITTTALPDGKTGVGYAAAVHTDTRVDATTITTGRLPDGLQLDTETGQIVGIPTRAGTFSFEVSATNSAGHDTRTYAITVSESQSANSGTKVGAGVGLLPVVSG